MRILLAALVVLSFGQAKKIEIPEGSLCIGIDLGTTFSVSAIDNNGKVEVINNRNGNPITPSLVAIDSSGQIVVGDAAKPLLLKNPKDVVVGGKRFIGRQFSEDSVKTESNKVDYEVVETNQGMAGAKIGSKIMSFSETSSHVLKYLMGQSNNYLSAEAGKKVNIAGSVITVPAYFHDNHRKATKEAAQLAGINPLHILSEPVAAALASSQLNDMQGHLVVIDIGGGTSDISVLKIDEGIFETEATTGDLHLGGQDFDHLLVEMIQKKAADSNIQIKDMAQLREQAEQIKIQLSTSQIADIEHDEFSGTITRHQFEVGMKPYLAKIKKLILDAIERSNLKPTDIKEFLLTGGSSRIPALHKLVKDTFRKDPIFSSNPDHAIAIGAAKYAAQLCGHTTANTVLISHTPFGYSVKTVSGSSEMATFIIDPYVAVPATHEKTFGTAQDFQTGVHVEIFQGFSKDLAKNTKIGTLHYDGLPSRPAGQAEVKVTFKIDEDQTMTAEVIGLHDGAVKKDINLQLSGTKMDNETIEKLRAEAEADAARVDYIQEAEAKLSEAFYSIKSTIIKESISEAHKGFVENLETKWNEIKLSKDLEEIKQKMDPLLEEAKPILAEIGKAKAKALEEYNAKENTGAHKQPESTDSTYDL
ncbi:MAG: Endoplasmic reticulum chaperone BiP [Paramarteilia canceri]